MTQTWLSDGEWGQRRALWGLDSLHSNPRAPPSPSSPCGLRPAASQQPRELWTTVRFSSYQPTNQPTNHLPKKEKKENWHRSFAPASTCQIFFWVNRSFNISSAFSVKEVCPSETICEAPWQRESKHQRGILTPHNGESWSDKWDGDDIKTCCCRNISIWIYRQTAVSFLRCNYPLFDHFVVDSCFYL